MANIIDVNGKLITVGQENDTVKPPLLLESKTTATEVTDVPLVSPKEILEDEGLLIQTPIFLLFAEFLGYVSKLVNMADEWCDPNKPMPSETIQILLDREARTIYDEMLEEFTEKQIREFYKVLYTCGLDELEDDLIQKRKDFGEDLPF